MKAMKKEKFEIKWWEDWLNADLLKKEEMVKKLPIVKELSNVKNLPKDMKEMMIAQLLNSYFEDLENAVYTKIRNEKKDKKSKRCGREIVNLQKLTATGKTFS